MLRLNASTRNQKTGFTLIELLIVVGIIAVLIVVLAIAVLPWLSKSDEKATRTILSQIGSAMSGGKVVPTIAKFKKDAGQLSGKISGEEDKASSQMMLFYMAPSRSTWEGSALYKGRNYEPTLTPEDFAEFTREDSGKLPYLVDAWDKVIWYDYDKAVGGMIWSAGEDMQKRTPDDLVFDPRDAKVKKRDEITK
jgi:prepilin-type N-terminal cleavage/methylation domain-containing protein